MEDEAGHGRYCESKVKVVFVAQSFQRCLRFDLVRINRPQKTNGTRHGIHYEECLFIAKYLIVVSEALVVADKVECLHVRNGRPQDPLGHF